MHKWCSQLVPSLRGWDRRGSAPCHPHEAEDPQVIPPSPNTQSLQGRAVSVTTWCLSLPMMSSALAPLFQFNLKLLVSSVGLLGGSGAARCAPEPCTLPSGRISLANHHFIKAGFGGGSGGDWDLVPCMVLYPATFLPAYPACMCVCVCVCLMLGGLLGSVSPIPLNHLQSCCCIPHTGQHTSPAPNSSPVWPWPWLLGSHGTGPLPQAAWLSQGTGANSMPGTDPCSHKT